MDRHHAGQGGDVTAAVVALATTCIVLAVALLLIVRSGAAERSSWATERQRLVDRAIARHAGEIKALDRSGTAPHQKVNNGPLDTPIPVGL
jgi:hypothetical protein